jgi:predicted CoA-binding protein
MPLWRPEVNSADDIQSLLDDTTTWFVVGLADNPARDAWHVAAYLQSLGKRVVPVHPRAEVVHGEQGYATVADAAAAVGAPDVVDVFVRADHAGAIADEALASGTRAVWFQFGVIDAAAAARVEDAGRIMVMDRCPKVEFPPRVSRAARSSR